MAGNSSTLTDMVLGAVARARISIRTVFNLSVKMVAAPSVLRAHPSGTDTVNRPVGGVNGTNAWLSGMSPAGLVSGAGAAAVLVLRVAEPDGAVPLAPHPPSTAAVANTAAATANVRVGFLMTSAQGAVHRCRAGAPRARRGGPLRSGCRGGRARRRTSSPAGPHRAARRPAARRVGPTGRAGPRMRQRRWSRTPRPGSPPR